MFFSSETLTYVRVRYNGSSNIWYIFILLIEKCW